MGNSCLAVRRPSQLGHVWTTIIGITTIGIMTAASPVRARSLDQHVVVLPHVGDADLESERNTADREVHQALLDQGFQVYGRASARDNMCQVLECASELLAETGTQLAVAVGVWHRGEADVVYVTLVDVEGNRYSGQAPIEIGRVAEAAKAALLDARGLQLLGPGPWVHVEGSPEGASVEIDGSFVGVLPYRGALGPGDHRLEVSAAGYVTEVRTLKIPDDPAVTTRTSVGLRAGDGDATAKLAELPDLTDRPPPPYEASVWNFLLGGAAVAGGIAIATVDPVRTAMRQDDCASGTMPCTEWYGIGKESIAKVVGGSLLAVTGVAFMIWQPLQVEAEVGDRSAKISLRGQF